MGAPVVAGPTAKQSGNICSSVLEATGIVRRDSPDVSPWICAGQLGSTFDAFTSEGCVAGATRTKRPRGEKGRRGIVRSVSRTTHVSGVRCPGKAHRLWRADARSGRRTEI